jgi:hypothetical protein
MNIVYNKAKIASNNNCIIFSIFSIENAPKIKLNLRKLLPPQNQIYFTYILLQREMERIIKYNNFHKICFYLWSVEVNQFDAAGCYKLLFSLLFMEKMDTQTTLLNKKRKDFQTSILARKYARTQNVVNGWKGFSQRKKNEGLFGGRMWIRGINRMIESMTQPL